MGQELEELVYSTLKIWVPLTLLYMNGPSVMMDGTIFDING